VRRTTTTLDPATTVGRVHFIVHGPQQQVVRRLHVAPFRAP
jgi:hypothetical protein